MQNIRIYAAPSLSEVINHLLLHRFTGMLTIWPVVGIPQEDTIITIDLGRPIVVCRGSHRENATESILAWLNSWGEIHFIFQPSEARLRLPSPRPTPRVDQTNSSHIPTPFALPQQQPLSTTQPLSANNWSAYSTPYYTNNQQAETSPVPPTRQTRELTFPPDLPPHEVNWQLPSSSKTQAIAPESAIAFLTDYGREYTAVNLPRYDRTIFLLINGKRTLSDLSQLTKRPQEEVFATLQRLENLQLIDLETS